LLSVISLLTEGNISSPANVEASVQFRKWREGSDDTFFKKVEAEVKISAAAAVAAGIIVPTTVEDYCIESKTREIERITSMDSVDAYGDDDACPSDFDYDTTDDEFDDSFDDGQASSPMHATGGGGAAAKEDEGIAGKDEMDAEMAGGGGGARD
jgi:ubiquitin-conjugating enzyme E2 R